MHPIRITRVVALALASIVGVALAGGACSQPAASTVSQPANPESIGSLRNARVAFPIPESERANPPTLTFLAGDIPGEVVDELKKTSPNLRLLHGLSRQQALEHAAEAHGIDSRFATPEVLAKATKLVWVQSMSAGVEHLMANPRIAESDSIVLTNMRAVHGPTIADHSFAMLLTLTRNMREHAENQAKERWGRGGAGGRLAGADPGDPPTLEPIALQGRTMLVVGLGGIGTEIAQRAHGFGMRVTAIRRSDAPAPEYVERLGHADDLLEMLPEADVVAICLPLTDETKGLFNSAVFQAMKPGAYLINIARGAIVDTDALVAALDSRRLAGACLDVTDPEPLPAGHTLWKRRNVVITPHVASNAELTSERRWAVMRENLRRFAAGEPLLNVVDKKAGY